MITRSYRLRPGERGTLVLERPGCPPEAGVRVRRAFPWSRPLRYISVRSSSGTELEMIDDLQELPPEERQLVQDALSSTHFVPRILRVLAIAPRDRRWQVLTDRGPTEIQMQDREDIHALPDGRFLVRDVYGNVHELPALEHLDGKSRRLALEML